MAKKKTAPARPPGKSESGPMDLGLLERIVRLMTEGGLNRIDVRDGARRIVMERGLTGGVAPIVATSAPPQATTAAPPPSAGATVDPDAGLVAIKSPMVGTFYASPSPDAKAFVAVGSVVDEDTDVCIIEAMKVFNNIKAETRGVIARVLVANGQTVEFAQPLFLVKPA